MIGNEVRNKMAKHDGIDLPELTKSLIMFIYMHTQTQ